MRTSHYIVKSLELHLFFGRIMKEHALFLRAGFTPANSSFSAKAELYMKEFEEILNQAVSLSDGNVSRDVLSSGEVITRYTALAEEQTECLTGIPIDKLITQRQECLNGGNCTYSQELQRQIHQLNHKVLQLLDGLISFKETILKNVLQGEIFTSNYPLLIDHITREAKDYRKYLKMLEKDGRLPNQSLKEIECFWNQIMMEHAQFIRGLLDPCETELFNSADEFSKTFCKLLEDSRNACGKTLTNDSLDQTIKLRDFKAAGTQSIQQCKIRSIILPLLADHVLREANHYIRLLKT